MAFQPQNSFRARSSPTTTSTTPTQPMNSSRSSATGQAACAIIKHANPCGVAIGSTMAEAYKKALACDPVSAYGGILAFNKKLDGATAEEISKLFTEGDHLRRMPMPMRAKILSAKAQPSSADRWRPARSAAARRVSMHRTVAGGFLVQNRDNGHIAKADLKIVTKRQPTEQELADMLFAFTIGKHVKSNAPSSMRRTDRPPASARGQMSRASTPRAHRSAESERSTGGRRLGGAVDERFGRCVGRVFPVRRRLAHRRGSGCHRGHPARRFDPRRRSDQGRRRAQPRHGLHRDAPFPALDAAALRAS